MFKFLVYSVLLWQGICIISADQMTSETDTKIPCIPCMAAIATEKNKNSNEPLTNELNNTEPNEKYNIHVEHQVFNINGLLSTNHPFCPNICQNNYGNWKLRSDYVATNGKSSFKLHLRKLPWNRARRICTEEGGHLAVPRTDAEETEILKMMLADSVDDAWLGIHDQYEEGDWITVLDEALAKTGWAKWSKLFPNNPDNYKGKQNCARLVKNGGGMDDEMCDRAISFVCKISTL